MAEPCYAGSGQVSTDVGGTCLPHILQRRNGAHLHNTAMKKIFWGQTQEISEVDVDVFFGVKRLQNGPEGAEGSAWVFCFVLFCFVFFLKRKHR